MLQLVHMKRKNKRKGMVSIEVISVKIIGKTKRVIGSCTADHRDCSVA